MLGTFFKEIKESFSAEIIFNAVKLFPHVGVRVRLRYYAFNEHFSVIVNWELVRGQSKNER